MQSVTRLTQTTLILVLCTTLACRAGKKDEDLDTATPNSPPVPSGGVVVVTDEDASAVVNLSATDAEGDALEYAIAVMPEHGSLSPEDPGRQSQVTYIPDPDFNGEDSFAYTVADEYDVANYTMALKAATGHGKLDTIATEDKIALAKFREEKRLSSTQHTRAVKEAGWSVAEYDVGVRGYASRKVKRSKAAAVLR